MLSLPIGKVWFRSLLLWSVPIGIVGGLVAAVYTLTTATPINALYGNTTTGYWSGDWWWILLSGFGGLTVAWLRSKWSIAGDSPSAIEIAQKSIVDKSTSLQMTIISVFSLIFGASLGPSYGIILLSGLFGSWVYSKYKPVKELEIEKEFTRAGFASGLGGVLTDPVMGSLFTMEISPSKKPQLAITLPRIIAATLGFITLYGFTGSTLLNSFNLPDYEFRLLDLLYGVLIGVMAIVVLFAFGLLNNIIKRALTMIHNSLLRGLIGGASVGLIAYAIPLSLGSGNGQLVFATDHFAEFSLSLIAVTLLAKMVAINISLNSGFIGGNVFPMLFVGGISGLLVHALLPDIPVALCVSSLMAAVPGATLSAPLTIILVAVAGVGLGATAIPPIAIAVIVAQLGLVFIQSFKQQNKASLGPIVHT